MYASSWVRVCDIESDFALVRGCSLIPKERSEMSAEENKRLVRRFYEEIDKGNLDAMDELVDEKLC
jgi:hypothetical protein